MLVKRLEKAGALVSRLDSKQLRSGYVMLEPGNDVGEHKTEDGEELILIVDGKAEIMINGQREIVESPCVSLIPAKTIHNVKNISTTLLKYVYVVVAKENLGK